MKIRKLVIIIGRGTKKEKHIITDIDMYFSETLNKWVTIPND